MQRVMNGTDYARLSEYLYNSAPPLVPGVVLSFPKMGVWSFQL
jgi:hypothetical protein